MSALLPDNASDFGEILLYLDDGSTRPYTPSSVCFKLDTEVSSVSTHTHTADHIPTHAAQQISACYAIQPRHSM